MKTMKFTLRSDGGPLPVPIDGWPLARVEASDLGLMRAHFDRPSRLLGIHFRPKPEAAVTKKGFAEAVAVSSLHEFHLSLESSLRTVVSMNAALVPAELDFASPYVVDVGDVVEVRFARGFKGPGLAADVELVVAAGEGR